MVLMVGSRLCIAPVGSSLKGYKYIRVAWQRPTVCVRSCALQTPYPIEEPALREGPSCVFVGPVETAQKDRLEALYRQARDSYYNGQPLIVDDMFDKVEVRLRWYGSKLVMKYPRCSLKRLSVYSDAEADNSQILALASIWMLFLVIGLISALGVPVCTLSRTCKETAHYYLFNHVHNHMLSSDLGISMNVAVIAAMGVLIGVPVSTAA
ncbi:hypothetical protein KP509_38G026000 [Ceratopteris richardii]|nr:hypothetical protein KP509_38G026000 [Ceratopteris richardii]